VPEHVRVQGSRAPARDARWRSQLVAACRSIRAPRVLSRIGAVAHLSTDRSMARPAAVPEDPGAFADNPQRAVAVFLAEVGDFDAGRFEDA